MKGALIVILSIAIIIVVFAFALMLLWNWLMPDIFSLPQINFWQSLGLLAISTILFNTDSIRMKGD